jgi:SAM-dependent methyltransferase
VLDVGCGKGFYSMGMARLVGANGRVISVDVRTEALEALRIEAAQVRLSERIEPRLGTDSDLAIDDLAGGVDFALAVYVVHHAADPARLMGNVHRALKPGGVFLVVEPRHHASAAECEATETTARESGFTIAGHPKLRRDWAVCFTKGSSLRGDA